jgi:hypothetical protein
LWRNRDARLGLRRGDRLVMVRAMFRMLRVAACAALALTACGCSRGKSETAAASAAQTLLSAAWSGDAARFEAGIDRPALRADLRRRLMQVAQANTLAVEGGASDAALDRMVTPQAFTLTDARTGAPLAAAPTTAQVAPLIALPQKDRACLHPPSDAKLCLLTFAREGKAWKLVAMAPPGFVVPIPPEPPAKR